MTDLASAVDRHGFATVDGVLDPTTVSALVGDLDQFERPASDGKREPVYAIRHLMGILPTVSELASSRRVRGLIGPLLGTCAFPVQGIFFDKRPGANWKVPWHQDLTIPVQARVEVPGFGPWSVKDGVPHVQAPAALLERMVIVRLHLDAGTDENGPLRVIPGSHRYGRLQRDQLERLCAEEEPVSCLVPSGGALVMRPLLLHASSAARVPGHRRVIHLQYAAEPLPGGLTWRQDLPLHPSRGGES